MENLYGLTERDIQNIAKKVVSDIAKNNPVAKSCFEELCGNAFSHGILKMQKNYDKSKGSATTYLYKTMMTSVYRTLNKIPMNVSLSDAITCDRQEDGWMENDVTYEDVLADHTFQYSADNEIHYKTIVEILSRRYNSDRDKYVFRSIMSGLSVSQTARNLGISRQALFGSLVKYKNYLLSIYQKNEIFQ